MPSPFHFQPQNHLQVSHMDDQFSCFHETTFTDPQGLLRTTRVPSVQELARQGPNHFPNRFIQLHPNPNPNGSKLVLDHVSEDLPSISVAKLRAPSGRAQELEKLAWGAKKWGMFMVMDHGIDSCVVNGVKEVVKSFFGLSFEEKRVSVGSYSSVDNMGYGRNFVKSEEQPLDWIDRLAMKAAPRGASGELHVWPQNPSDFRQVMEKYVEEARKVLNELLEALAEALSLERQVFIKNFDPQESEINVRINYYPPCPRPDLALGITPHSDASALTLLMQFDTNGGLQVLKDQKWVTVPWQKEALLVNVGDLLEIMSNGRVKSPWHRVVTHKEVDRFSVALFYNPPSKAEIEPVEGELEGLDKYKKVVVGDYLRHFYEISPAREKKAIMFARVSEK